MAGVSRPGCNEALDRTAVDQDRDLSFEELRCPLSLSCLRCRLPSPKDRGTGLWPCRPGGPGEPPGGAGLGVLTGEIGPELVDRVIGMAGCREKRRRRPRAGRVGAVGAG